MAYDPTRRFPDPHCRPLQRPAEAHHGDARDRQVGAGASFLGAVRQDRCNHLVVLTDALVAAVFRYIEDVTLCEPRQLRREHIALVLGCRDGHREPVRENLGDQSSSRPTWIDIGDYAFAQAVACRDDQG